MDPSSNGDKPGLLIDLDASVCDGFQLNNDCPSGDFNAVLAISDVFGSSPAPAVFPSSPIERSSFDAPFPGENSSSFGGGGSINPGFGAPAPVHNVYGSYGFENHEFGAVPVSTGFQNGGFGDRPSSVGLQKNGFGGPEDFDFHEAERVNNGFGTKAPGYGSFANGIRSETGFDINHNKSNGIYEPHFPPSPSNNFTPVRPSPSSNDRLGPRNDRECDFNPAVPPPSLVQHSISPVFPTGDFNNRPSGAWSPRNSPAKRRRDRCNRCGRYGHMTEHCYTNSRNTGTIRCYNCNKVGHLAVRCFEPRAPPRGRPSVSVISGGSRTDSLTDFRLQSSRSISGGRVARRFVDIVDPNNEATTGVGIICKMMQDPYLRKEAMHFIPEVYDEMMNFMMQHVKL